ncbi:MAG TPA: potassium-transporting ATPase subunit KdpA [Fibrobacteria bacterium]|nr:potassium-transporting ATPase subunit KdpA [Fibrobacteria bacterium]
MEMHGWIQLFVFCALLLALTKPFGLWLKSVLDSSRKSWMDPLCLPLEKGIYRLLGIDPSKGQDWKGWIASVVLFNLAGIVLTYLVLVFQGHLPLNPQGFSGLPWHLAFDTAVSFATNTNWQNYGGENTMSYFSQMVGLAVHNFTSAGTGIVVAAALVRGICGRGETVLGNFWVDIVRIHTRLLVPLAFVFALFLVSQGAIMNFHPYQEVKTLAGVVQHLPMGPAASQLSIKMLGTNGGGFFNTNAAHPFENPTALSNFLQILSIFVIPAGLVWWMGDKVGNRRHGWTVWAVMFALFLAGVLTCWHFEAAGNPHVIAHGVASQGNWEGKETRFGIFESSLFATVTTDASCGAVNSMHDSFTPMGGFVPLFNLHLGEVVFGGVGAGLYGMIVFIFLGIFLAGLMVGRTPEYLGRKIQSFDVKMASIVVLFQAFGTLIFTAIATATVWGAAGVANNGPHGFTEILYAFSSAVANNGSAFAGLTGNTPWYDTTLAIAMLIGRYAVILPVLAIAGNFCKKIPAPPGPGTFPIHGPTFAALLLGTVVVVGALTYFPALVLGPVVEHFLMTGSNILY